MAFACLEQRTIHRLVARGVLHDGRDISAHVWRFMTNPSPWALPLTESAVDSLVADDRLQRPAAGPVVSLPVAPSAATRLLARRESTREFGNRTIPIAALARMLWAAYGVVPSVTREAQPRLARSPRLADSIRSPCISVVERRVGRLAPGSFVSPAQGRWSISIA